MNTVHTIDLCLSNSSLSLPSSSANISCGEKRNASNNTCNRFKETAWTYIIYTQALKKLEGKVSKLFTVLVLKCFVIITGSL